MAFNGCCGPGRASLNGAAGRRQLHFAQRFAIDWMQLDAQGRLRNGPVNDVRSYTAYGAELLATADGVVVSALDGLPDQVPPKPRPQHDHAEERRRQPCRARPRQRLLCVLRAHEARLGAGARGSEGQRRTVLGLLGNSGNSTAPHLHFHVMDTGSVLGSEGLPLRVPAMQAGGQHSRFRHPR